MSIIINKPKLTKETVRTVLGERANMHIGIKDDTSGFVWTHRLIDLIIPYIVLYSLISVSQIEWHDRYTIAGVLGGFIYVTSAQMVGVYQSWRGRKLFTSFQFILKAWILTWTFLIIVAFFIQDSNYFSKLNITLWAVITPVIYLGYRLAVRLILGHFRQKGENSKKIAIIGAGKVGQQLQKTLEETPWLGYKVVGFFDDNPGLQNKTINNIPILGKTDQVQVHAVHKFDEVYICLPLRAEDKLKEILDALTHTAVVVKFIPDLFSFDLMHAKWTDLKGIPVISVFDTPLNNTTAQLIKRIEDLFFTSIILLLISPVMIGLAIIIKSTSRGPVFYKQNRVGWNGSTFQMLKFRSMHVDVEKNSIQWGGANSKEITNIGKLMRKYSLDELPQFINVLKGEMTIVGPRPERDIFVEQFRNEIPRYMQKHMVKAGITGWAQVNGWRGDTCLQTRIEFDLDYIQRWSPWLDIKIIVLTIFKGFINKDPC